MALAARKGGADDAIARFVLDVVEEWRDVAGDCLAMVPGAHGLPAGPLLSESPDEMELIGRALVALGMASRHPEFPAPLREPIHYGMEAYRAWLPRYAATVKPIGEVEARAAPPRIMRRAALAESGTPVGPDVAAVA
jgi:hypothetical protein